MSVSAIPAGAPLRRALGAGAIVALPVALALGIAFVLETPRVLAGLAVAAAGAWIAWRWARENGALGLWAAALVVSLAAGEMTALPLGGQSGRLLWADLVLAAGLVVALIRGRGVVEAPGAPFLTVVGLFCAWGAISLLAAADVLTGIAELKEWLVMTVAGGVFLTWARDPRRASLLLGCVAVVGAGIALWMALTAWSAPGGPLFAVLMKQVDLPWGRTNYLAGLLILSLPVALGLTGAAGRPAVRAGWAAVAAIVALGLVLSASKGAVLALGVALAAAMAVRPRLSRTVVVLTSLLIVAGVLVFVAGPLQQVLAYRTQESALGYSMGERRDLYALGWEAFAGHPLTGVGLNNFSVLAHRLRGVDTVPHNLFIGFLAELGLAGGALAGALVLALLHAARRACRLARGPSAAALALGVWIACVGFAVHNQFESTIYGEQYKIMLAAVAAAAWRLSCGPVSESAMAHSNGDG